MYRQISFIFLFFFSIHLYSQTDVWVQAQPYIQETSDGLVDWTNQFVESTGSIVLNRERYPDEQQAMLMAIRGAELVAKANLLETIEGILVYRETTVRDFMTESDFITGKVEGLVKGARIVGEPKRSGNLVEVTIRVPLYASNGLAPAIYKEVKNKSKYEPAPPSALPVEKDEESLYNEPDVLDAKMPQFVLDFKNGKFNPSLFPILIDEKGDVVFDFSEHYGKVSPDILKYVNLTKGLMKEMKFSDGVEVIEAIQNFDGTIKVKTEKHPKFKKFLQEALGVGKVVLPILFSLI